MGWASCPPAVGDDDGDFGDETVLLTSTQVDDDSFAGGDAHATRGYVGLFRGNQDTNIHQFDDFKVGYDNNADGDFDDGGDFGDSVTNGAISLSYDANGNLTDDGIFAYAYDAWNRLRLAKLVVGADETTIGDYRYYGDTRRAKKIVTNHGPKVYLNDGGNTETRIFCADLSRARQHAGSSSMCEMRNASNQTIQQVVWGTRSDLVMFESNSDPIASNDTNPDVTVRINKGNRFGCAAAIAATALLSGCVSARNADDVFAYRHEAVRWIYCSKPWLVYAWPPNLMPLPPLIHLRVPHISQPRLCDTGQVVFEESLMAPRSVLVGRTRATVALDSETGRRTAVSESREGQPAYYSRFWHSTGEHLGPLVFWNEYDGSDYRQFSDRWTRVYCRGTPGKPVLVFRTRGTFDSQRTIYYPSEQLVLFQTRPDVLVCLDVAKLASSATGTSSPAVVRSPRRWAGWH